MTEEKTSRETTETESAKATESQNATRQESREYYDYDKVSVTAGEYNETTPERATEVYDAATVKAGEVVARSHDPAMRQLGLISAPLEAGKRAYGVKEVGRLLDATGTPIEGLVEQRLGALDRTTPEGFINLTINQGEFDRLSIKTREILAEAALAQERIAKDQEEINLLKTETREMLRRLRAA
jgi:hypothetical protein